MSVNKKNKFNSKFEGFEFQIDAIRSARNLEYSAIFHEQGLGKTKIAIDIALDWLKGNIVDCVIIVAKKGLIKNWEDEVKLHSFIKARVLRNDRMKNYYVLNSPARIILMHYQLAKIERRRLKLFAKGKRVGIILDESQVIKNPDSDLSAIFHELSGDFKRKMILTGTPIANRPFDIWSQIYFLDKGKSLGESFLDFKRNTDLTNDLHENIERKDDFVNALSKINKKIKSFCFRETKKSSKINLPNKIYHNIDVILNPEQLDYYEKYRDELGGVLLINGIPEFDNAENLLKKMLRLVEIASNPFIFDNEYNHEPSKYQYLIDIIDNITSKSEKCIIWSNFIKNVEWLYRHLNEFNPVRIHGNLKIDDRNKFIEKFKSDKTCQLLIATPASLKEGFTLTVANHCVFYDRSFSLDDYLQAQDRIHRISQEKECYVYNLIAQNTIDIWIDELLGAKELASRLGQGDIDKGEYIRQANYDYGLMISNILNLN